MAEAGEVKTSTGRQGRELELKPAGVVGKQTGKQADSVIDVTVTKRYRD